MHTWGDEDVDWKGINGACDIIETILRKWRVPVRQVKEKYGTVRVYTGLGWNCLLDITHPGYVSYYKYPKWLVHFDIYYGHQLLSYIGLRQLSTYIHSKVYRYAYKKAVQTYPHLRNEIISCADYDELLKGI